MSSNRDKLKCTLYYSKSIQMKIPMAIGTNEE